MPFILIAKAADGQLRLLTESSFATRGEALSELSRITANPSFDQWDDEVLAIDLDTGTPVLLVRPAEATAPAVEEFEEALTEDDEAEEPVDDAEAETDASEESATAFAAEADVAADDESDGAVDEAPDDDTELAEAEDEEPGEEPAPSLKDALKRTTVQLEAEGIVAPESVGPAPAEPADEEATADAQSGEPTAAAAWPWATTQEDKTFELDPLEAPGNYEGSLVRAPGDDDTMSFARPVIMGAYGEETTAESEESATEPEPEPEAEAEPEAVTEPESELEAEPVTEPEPAPELEHEVEPEPAPEHAVESDEEASHAAEVEFAPEVPLRDSDALVDSEEPVAPAPVPASESMGATDTSTEDAIDDLLADVTAAHAAPQPASESSDFVDLPPTAVTPPIDTMTCDDCVYTDSCPNKGQMAPASCGSFQWK